MAGAGWPDRRHLLRSDITERLLLGAGALVVTEFPDNAAFDHDRTLRALLARDHSRRRARRRPRDLLHFGEHGIERHPHQGRRDFRLCFQIIGDADRREDGFIQRWRVAPHASCSVLGIPIFAHWRLIFDTALPRSPYVALQYEIHVANQLCATISLTW